MSEGEVVFLASLSAGIWPLAAGFLVAFVLAAIGRSIRRRHEVERDLWDGLHAVNGQWVTAMVTSTPKPTPTTFWNAYPDEAAPGENPDPAPAEPTLTYLTKEN